MKSRKGLVLTAIVLFGTLFFAFRSNKNQIDGSDPLQQRLLNAVGSLLEQEHYSQKQLTTLSLCRYLKNLLMI